MTLLPELTTERLLLRALTPADSPAVQRLAGRLEIAATTLTIPHPYPDGAAEAWIESLTEDIEAGKGLVFAITLREYDALCGTIGLHVNRKHRHAELGYWIGVEYWGRGYATEAARELVRFAFEALDLHRVYAHTFVGNDASGRVLLKVGMRPEGRLRGHILKDDTFLDIEQYGMLRSDWTPAPR